VENARRPSRERSKIVIVSTSAGLTM
jgi:hypothetical protein